jgi:hypothetical protein
MYHYHHLSQSCLELPHVMVDFVLAAVAFDHSLGCYSPGTDFAVAAGINPAVVAGMNPAVEPYLDP